MEMAAPRAVPRGTADGEATVVVGLAGGATEEAWTAAAEAALAPEAATGARAE